MPHRELLKRGVPIHPLDVLLSWADDEVLDVVKERLAGDKMKLALLIVRYLNPEEQLTKQEQAEVMGIDRKTLRGMKQRGEIEG